VRSRVSSSDLINNIGKPFDNTSAFVLDPRSRVILPRGAVGELCFGGYQIFKGYLNQPDLTAEKVLNHPKYGRVYRSGDLGMLLDNDSILFMGRMDDQVKIHGQRVELGEVSSAVLDQECVQDCATLLLPFAQSSQRLVNFWVPATGGVNTVFSMLDGRALRSNTLAIYASLLQRLPSYMVPSHLVPISRLPMTMQGKIDKRVLQASLAKFTDKELKLTTHSCYNDTGGETTITAEWEGQAAKILAETLGLSSQEIKRHTSFFSIGLDSVSAIGFSNRMRKTDLGEFSISKILKNPTIAQLALAHEQNTETNINSTSLVIPVAQGISPIEVSRIEDLFSEKDVPLSKIMPCTPLQEAMLAGRHSASESTYSNIMVFTVAGDLPRLQESWATMFQRHEILRTSFVATNDPAHAFVQAVSQDTSINWGSIDWSTEAYQYAKNEVSALVRQDKPPVWLAIARAQDSTRLLFCCHHAMYDGIAIQNLLHEVQELYCHRELPPPISYEIYLQYMLSQDLREADTFWTERFRDFEPTSFPNLTERARTGSQSSAARNRTLQVPLSQALESCQNASVSLISMIQATWAKLLHFYTGESDICFGNVVGGRALTGHNLERLVAPCFNTIPVRIKFDFGTDNSALLQQLHALNVDSLAFHLTPLRRILNIVLKDGGRLFDTLVILQQPSNPLDNTIWTLEEDRGEMDLPLVCEISQDAAEDRLDLVLHYHLTVMSEKEAGIVAETFDAVLATMLNHPQARAYDIIDLPSNLCAESNTSIRPRRLGVEFLHSGFEQIAETHPDQIALDFLHAKGARTVWSFQTLNDRANTVAHALILAGVKPEDIIPVHLAKGPMFYASVLGVLKAGAAFAPIHPDLPVERKRFMFMELKTTVVIHSEASPVSLFVDNVTSIDVETLEHCSRSNPIVHGLTGWHLAYCLFTSGSTGVPKAVSMEHRAPMQTIEASRSLVPWSTSSRLLQFAAITFDMCFYDCFLAWTLGFTLCTAEQDMMLNDLPKMVNTLEVNLLDLTPSVAASLTRSEVPNVKWLYCIGETMSPTIMKEWAGACVNSYGPTETAFCTTMFPVSENFKTSIIGKPFPSTSFAVCSANGDRTLPLLSTGELYIGGAQLARGYLGNPTLTDEKFITMSGQRYYRSGDVVRMLADGNFEFMGRTDDQVKVRGLRVELGEINVVLEAAHSDMITAVTQIQKQDTAAKAQLVAYLVARQGVSDEKRNEIRHAANQTARGRLPSYMVPQFFLFVDQIPRSLAGKVDKKALYNVFRHSADVQTLPYGASPGTVLHHWTTLESHVRDIFARLSSYSLEDVSPSTTIYQLGLDSISAVQIATALRRQGFKVIAADVMKHLTCMGIAECMKRKADVQQEFDATFDFESFDAVHRAHVVASCGIPTDDIATIYPCTPLQKGIISQMLAKDGAVYINHIRLQLKPSVDLDAMKQAWTTALVVHQILRTGFAHLKSKRHPFGMIEYTIDTATLPWDTSPDTRNVESLRTWLGKLQRKATIELHRPLWCIRIVNDSDTTYLDLAIFHALFDAQSLQFIFHDVAAAYGGQSLRDPVRIDSAIDGILQRSNDKHDRSKHFWEQMGNHTTSCRFPNMTPLKRDPGLPVVSTYRSAKSLCRIERACREANTTVQAVGLASWLTLISAYTGESTATCGVVLSGRSFETAEDVVFPCINTVPFAHSVKLSSQELLNSVTSLIAEVQQHQHVSLNDIQRFLGFPNEPTFDTIFAYQKLPTHDDRNSLWRIVDENATTEYPVSIELEPKDDHLEYRLTTLPHIIPREQSASILEQFDHLMESFIFPRDSTNDLTTSLYSVTPAKELIIPSHARLLHDFVEIIAMEHPQRIALEFARSIDRNKYFAHRWTYSELDNEGNRVANLLLSRGVRPGDLVGVCFDKCPEASFAMLGVLKTGCAFVAIDPAAPAARQSYIIQDSGAVAVLSMAQQSTPFMKAVNVPVLDLDEIDTGLISSTKPVLEREINQQDRSYCLYTSGTTGTPKGCELTHENAVQALLSFQRLFAGHWNSESRWLQFASFHFDVSVLEQYWSWSVGICVVSAPRDVIFEDLANSINTLGITHIDLTPSLAQILHPDDVPTLCRGIFITGGESLTQEILDVWGPTGVIYNGYGPTEATIGCTMYPRVPANGKPSNIGPQFDNVGTFVLQLGTDIPVLRGAIGELCISGKLVGKGYLNRRDLTEKSFPYLERFRERVYRTGDLVRILHDGSFDFLGRADDQVKLRGQRLEISEINSVIRRADKSVSDVATLVLKHPRQQKEQLIAFVVQKKENDRSGMTGGSAPELAKAKEACHDQLPPYMVPTHFIPLASLPLNVNNKADSKKLKELYEDISAADLQKLSTGSEEWDQSWSTQEMKLRMIIKDELGVAEDAMGKETSFFELGMDSISVIGVARAVKQAGFTNATASLVMTQSTLHRLAKALSTGIHIKHQASLLAAQQNILATQHRHRGTAARSMAVNSSDIEALAPCTPPQQGMIARSLENNGSLYFNMFMFRLSNTIDCVKLRDAWSEVHATNQILRTIFIETEEGYVQAVIRNAALPWKVHSTTKTDRLSDSLAKLREEWLRGNQAAFKRPFEIVMVTEPEGNSLVVHIFHGLYDGISVDLIFNTVWGLYNGRQPSNHAPAFHEALAHGPLRDLDGAKSFWQEHLSTNVVATEPFCNNDCTGTSLTTVRELQALDGFESVRRKLSVTAQAIVQACWLGVLQEHFRTAITVGVVVSGRSIDLEGADRIAGPMFNTIPHQHRPQKSESWKSIIRRVQDFNVAVHPYQHTPLREIVKWSKMRNGQPLFDNLFVYQRTQMGEDWADNEVWKMVDGDASADYPIAFEIEQRHNDSWKLTLVTQGHIWNKATSNELLDRFEMLLHQAVTDASTTFELDFEIRNAVNDIENQEGKNRFDSHRDFQWTDDAVTLREIIAGLTSSEPDQINELTSIFELGLDSIDVIKLSSKLKRRGIQLPVSDIMRGLTIAKMLSHIQKSGDATQEERSSITDFQQQKHELKEYLDHQNHDTTHIEDVVPVTPLQEAMVAEMVASELARYYNFDVLKLSPGTDIARLRTAWTQVVEVSPILRTSFVEINDSKLEASYAQVIHALPGDFWSQRAKPDKPDFPRLFEELRDEAFQALSSRPPFSTLLMETPGQAYLILCISHALYDGWSLGILHADVKRAYAGQLGSRPGYQNALANIISASGADASTFWQDYLFAATPCTFTKQVNATGYRNTNVHRLELQSDQSTTALTCFAKKGNISLQTLGQSVFAIVIASYVQSLDVCFGSVLSGRDDEMTSQLLFPVMNTVAIRMILHGTRLELLRHMQDSFTNIKQWQHYPLRKALTLANARGRLFESLFIYQKATYASEYDAEQLYTSVEGHSEVEYPVCVEMEVVGNKLMWRCAVKDEVFSAIGAKELLSRLDSVLGKIMERPDEPVIDSSSQWVSVCGLPPFKKGNANDNIDANATFTNTTTANFQPRPETVRTIREVLADVSRTRPVEIADEMTIFHIGLDSISAIKAVSLLRQRDVILSVGEMLKAGTVGNMARIVDARSLQLAHNVADDTSSIIDCVLQDVDCDEILRRAKIEGCSANELADVQILPATAGQIYMISMWLNTNGSNFYSEFKYHLTGAISFHALQRAWKALIQANPILRTCIVPTHNRHMPYVQLIQQGGERNGSIIDVTDHSNTQITGQISQPWVRLFAAQIETGWDLRLKIHHALYDGVSLPIIIQQFQDICNGGTPLAPAKILATVVALGTEPSTLEDRKSFWSTYLHGVEDPGTSRVIRSRAPNVAKTEIFKRNLLSTTPLESFARQHGVSVQALFLTIYARLYAKLTRSPEKREIDVVLGLYLANRSSSIPGIESAAIPTVNLVPLRVRTPGQLSVAVAAQQIQKDLQNIGESTHSATSLWDISEWTGVKIDTFVNFLTLPEAREIEERKEEAAIGIKQAVQWEEDVSRIVEIPTRFQAEDEQHMKNMSYAEVNRAYMVTYEPHAFAAMTLTQYSILSISKPQYAIVLCILLSLLPDRY
jgi:amino acid adenylation domain-containing protein